jgi:hypothetical protein
VEGASQGRGRGRQVVSTAKTADLILMMLDATKSEEQRRLLEIELDSVGIRLNKRKPDVVFKRKTTGGVRYSKYVIVLSLTHIFFCRSRCVLPLRFSTILSYFQFTATVKLTMTDEKTIRTILAGCLCPPLSHFAILKPISR